MKDITKIRKTKWIKKKYDVDIDGQRVTILEVWKGQGVWKGTEEKFNELGGVDKLPYKYDERPFVTIPIKEVE